jgi:hypothetical protein
MPSPKAMPQPSGPPPANSQGAVDGSHPTSGAFTSDVDGVPALPQNALPESGLASLGDFPLPTRGEVFFFTTPRGEVEITARSVSNPMLSRLGRAAAVLALVVLAGWLIRLGRRSRFEGAGRSTAASVLILLGLLSIFFGVFPLLGLIAVVAGIVLKIERRQPKIQQA